jgi:multiple sugar transport system ATP-binding protein
MRTSLQQLHRRLGTTTIYVTHDQVEAMTLGQRVAVMRNGHVQQVDQPGRLYEEPANLFVAAFIGSPAMNLAEATLTDDTLSLGSLSVPLARGRRPSQAPNGRTVVGARPESFEDAAFASGDLPQFDVRVEVLESVGSDAYVFFEIDAPPVVVEEARTDEKEEDGALLTGQDKPLFAARVDPRTKARVGGTLRLALDPTRLYFFSPDSGASLLN